MIMKLKKFKKGDYKNYFKSVERVDYYDSNNIYNTWKKDLIFNHSLKDMSPEEKLEQLSEYFKYDEVKRYITDSDLTVGGLRHKVKEDMMDLVSKRDNSLAYKIGSKLIGWVSPVVFGGSLGVCLGSSLGTLVGFGIDKKVLLDIYEHSNMQDYIAALEQVKADARSQFINQIAYSELAIFTFAFASCAIYMLCAYRIDDKLRDYENLSDALFNAHRDDLDNVSLKDFVS